MNNSVLVINNDVLCTDREADTLFSKREGALAPVADGKCSPPWRNWVGVEGGVSETVKFSLALDAAVIRKHRGCRRSVH